MRLNERSSSLSSVSGARMARSTTPSILPTSMNNGLSKSSTRPRASQVTRGQLQQSGKPVRASQSSNSDGVLLREVRRRSAVASAARQAAAPAGPEERIAARAMTTAHKRPENGDDSTRSMIRWFGDAVYRWVCI